MSTERIPKVALRWTPAGKRRRGTPKTTWRKTVETELSEVCHGERYRQLRKTRPGGKESLLWPYAPLGAIRIDDDDDDD